MPGRTPHAEVTTRQEDDGTGDGTILSPLLSSLRAAAAWRHRLSEEDARDLVQEAFLLSVTKLKLSVNSTGWFNRVVDHLASNWRRKNRRRALLLARFWPAMEEAQHEQSEAGEK